MHLTNSVISLCAGADSYLESSQTSQPFTHPKQPLTYHRMFFFVAQNQACLCWIEYQSLFVHSDPSWVVFPRWGLSSCFVGIMVSLASQCSLVSAFNLGREEMLKILDESAQNDSKTVVALCHLGRCLKKKLLSNGCSALGWYYAFTLQRQKMRSRGCRGTTSPHIPASNSTPLWSEAAPCLQVSPER